MDSVNVLKIIIKLEMEKFVLKREKVPEDLEGKQGGYRRNTGIIWGYFTDM